MDRAGAFPCETAGLGVRSLGGTRPAVPYTEVSIVRMKWAALAAVVSYLVLSSTPAIASAADEAPAAGPVAITSDVAFAASAPDLTVWSPPLLDVYAPEDAQGLPLVVMLPPHSLTKTGSAALTQLANAVAGQGAVVVVTNWSQLADPPDTFEDPAALEEIAWLGQSYAGCAVSFAVSQAGEYGADPSRLVVVGQLFGANTASMIALGSPDPFAGCEATADWEATGLVAWDADWLVGMPAWDALGPDAARAVDALSPWSILGEAPRIPVELVVSDTWVAATQRCGDRDADWMVWRDPSGSMRERLDEVGAFDDGCQDLGEGAAAMAKQLTAAGFPAGVVRLTGSDLAPLAEAIAKVTQAPIR